MLWYLGIGSTRGWCFTSNYAYDKGCIKQSIWRSYYVGHLWSFFLLGGYIAFTIYEEIYALENS